MISPDAKAAPKPGQRSTEEWIETLSALPLPKPLRPWAASMVLLALIAVSLALFLAMTGLRAQLSQALQDPVVLAKSVLPLVLGGLALHLALTSARPAKRLQLLPLAVPALVAAILFGLWAAATPAPDLWPAIKGQTALACLASISGLSLGPVALGVAMMRRGASTRPTLSGGLIGLAVGGMVAAGYSLHCPEDSPMFYVVWYGLGAVMAGMIGALAGHRFLRW